MLPDFVWVSTLRMSPAKTDRMDDRWSGAALDAVSNDGFPDGHAEVLCFQDAFRRADDNSFNPAVAR